MEVFPPLSFVSFRRVFFGPVRARSFVLSDPPWSYGSVGAFRVEIGRDSVEIAQGGTTMASPVVGVKNGAAAFVLQLRRVTVQYCGYGGSSKNVRSVE